MPDPSEVQARLAARGARLDSAVMALGGAVAGLGVAAQVVGYVRVVILGADPIAGAAWLNWGMVAGGLGGAGVVYGIKVNAGGSVPYPGGPLSYGPPRRRWPSALFALAGFPMWMVLSWPLGVGLYGLATVGGVGYAIRLAAGWARRAIPRTRAVPPPAR